MTFFPSNVPSTGPIFSALKCRVIFSPASNLSYLLSFLRESSFLRKFSFALSLRSSFVILCHFLLQISVTRPRHLEALLDCGHFLVQTQVTERLFTHAFSIRSVCS